MDDINVIAGLPVMFEKPEHPPSRQSRQLGAILRAAHKLDNRVVRHVLHLQKQRPHLLFGEAAVKLAFITQHDLEQALCTQFSYLGGVTNGEGGRLSSELIAAHEPFGPKVEAVRTLRSQLALRWFNAGHQKLAILSPGAQEGRSYLAANLAVTFAQLGKRTLLIDADLRAPRQHLLFGLPKHAGLTGILRGQIDGDAFDNVAGLANLAVLPAGGAPPNPLELVSQGKFRQLLDGFCERYDVILIDTPAGDAYADAQVMAVQSEGVVAVARRHYTRTAQMQALCERVAMTGTALVGAVINRF
jgi:chain length determinant protein tyrosine kinase EpsG